VSGVQPARRIALEVILAVREDDAYANLLLPVKLERAKLTSADAALATELTYGTLRMQGYYDAVLQLAAKRPVSEIDPAILDVLRLACHQILSLRVADHAAVDEAVELAKTVGSRSAVGFVNGVLRTITRSSADDWHTRALDAARNPDERIATEFSHPTWVVRAFRAALAADGRTGELDALLGADNVPPLVSLAALPGLATVGELHGHSSAVSPVGAALDGGDPGDIRAVREGRARVQDQGSQIAALALSGVVGIAAGERWLDLCAGPGGKSALLAAVAAGSGATLIANEIVPARAQLVRNALAVFGDDAPDVWERDGTSIGTSDPEGFDRILLDAPCTGLGALRRRPEARWRKSPSDVAELARLQDGLLESAIGALKPGGTLAYVTCSPHPAETTAVVATALSRHPEIERVDTARVVRQLAPHPIELGETSHVQLWPHAHGTDAMFIQLLRKV
jgi:16S rRNA (cytosine967-C5)-methyltransferase